MDINPMENVYEITLLVGDHMTKKHFSYDVIPHCELRDIVQDLASKFERSHGNTDWNELDYLEEIRKFTNLALAKELWQRFEDVPMNPFTEEIEEAWGIFLVGTQRERIWHWFEDTFNISVTEDLMGLEEEKLRKVTITVEKTMRAEESFEVSEDQLEKLKSGINPFYEQMEKNLYSGDVEYNYSVCDVVTGREIVPWN